MELVSKNEVISNFISYEMKEIYEKYHGKNEEEIAAIVELINNAGKYLDGFNPYEDYEATRELAVLFNEERNINVVKLHQSISNGYSINITVDMVKDIISKLESNEVAEEDNYYIYYEGMDSKLLDIAEQDLIERLDDAYEVTRFFDSVDIAEMWINRKRKEEIVDDLLCENSWQELIGCREPEELFRDSNDRQIMIAIKEE